MKSRNSQIRRNAYKPPNKECNCRRKDSCPLNEKCLSQAIVYKATVVSDNVSKQYIGLAGGTFKERYNNHTKSFRLEKYQKETELSKYIWGLKKKEKEYSVKWDIIRRSNTRMRRSGICNLCLEEKFSILCSKTSNQSISLLNKRSELISKCRHNRKTKCRVKKKEKII
jgi:hypothetical protein